MTTTLDLSFREMLEPQRWTLKVSEIFGPTIQGEGPSLGRRCAFLRLAVCNLACTWCDTPYSWDWIRYNYKEQVHLLTDVEVLDKLTSMGVKMLVVSGGEPMLQQHKLVRLFHWLRGEYRFTDIHIETAGTIAPDPEVDFYITQYNVSPKLFNSGNPLDKRLKPEVLRTLARNSKAYFKFVVCDLADVREAASYGDDFGISRDRIFIMPEGTTVERITQVTREIADDVIRRGLNLTTRLHLLAWGDRRGK